MNQIFAEETVGKIMEKRAVQEEALRIENQEDAGYVTIKYEKVLLKEHLFLGGSVGMLLPETLFPMREEVIAVKYPNPDRPEYIYSDEEEEFTMTMTLEIGEVKDEDMEAITDIMAKEMHRLYPASPIEGKEMVTPSIWWFSLDIPLVDGESCHMLFFYGMSAGLVMGTFDCDVDSKKQWKPIARQLLLSLREEEETDQSAI